MIKAVAAHPLLVILLIATFVAFFALIIAMGREQKRKWDAVFKTFDDYYARWGVRHSMDFRPPS